MIETAARIPTAVEDYLRLEERAGVKHEYVDGELYAMAGASARHNRITVNTAFHLRAATRGGPCAVFVADMKLRVEAVNAFYYPDVMLCCDPADDHPLYKTAPCVVVEVVSPATAQIDRREKWQAYRRLVSLRAYVLVESERRQAEFYLREDDGGWRHGVLAEDAVLNLRCGPLSLSLGLDDLYEDVDLPPV